MISKLGNHRHHHKYSYHVLSRLALRIIVLYQINHSDHLAILELDHMLVLFPIKRQEFPHRQMQVVRTCSVYG